MAHIHIIVLPRPRSPHPELLHGIIASIVQDRALYSVIFLSTLFAVSFIIAAQEAYKKTRIIVQEQLFQPGIKTEDDAFYI